MFWSKHKYFGGSNFGRTFREDSQIFPLYPLAAEVYNFQHCDKALQQIPASLCFSETFSSSRRMTCPGFYTPKVNLKLMQDSLGDNLEACSVWFLRGEANWMEYLLSTAAYLSLIYPLLNFLPFLSHLSHFSLTLVS